MYSRQNIPYFAEEAVCLVRSSDTAQIRAYGDEVHQEGDCRDGEKHNGGPERGRRCPWMLVAGDDFVFGEEVFREGVGHSADHVGVQQQGSNSRDEAEDSNALLVYLRKRQLI